MISFSRTVLSTIRLVSRQWPFRRGKDIVTYAGAFATKIGLLGSAWYEFQPGLWMHLNARDLVQQTILIEGVWDPLLTELVQRDLRPGDTFIDVGAHVGYFTLLGSARVGPAGTVLSIEPNPFALKQLQQNLERSRVENVLVEQTACGESDDIVVQLYSHSGANSSMASRFSGKKAGAVGVGVPSTTLDRLCQKLGLHRVKLVKIDVEGSELFVLRGMKRLMRESRPDIVLELHPRLLEEVGTPLEDVLALMKDQNYVLQPLGGHSNYICRPNATVAQHPLS